MRSEDEARVRKRHASQARRRAPGRRRWPRSRGACACSSPAARAAPRPRPPAAAPARRPRRRQRAPADHHPGQRHAAAPTRARASRSPRPSGTISDVTVHRRRADRRSAPSPAPSTAPGPAGTATGRCRVDRRYTVTATAAATRGQAVTQTSTFTHADARRRPSSTQIFEGYQRDLRRRHADHADLQPADQRTRPRSSARCRSRTSKPVVGAWYWDGEPDACDFRPRELLAARTPR